MADQQSQAVSSHHAEGYPPTDSYPWLINNPKLYRHIMRRDTPLQRHHSGSVRLSAVKMKKVLCTVIILLISFIGHASPSSTLGLARAMLNFDKCNVNISISLKTASHNNELLRRPSVVYRPGAEFQDINKLMFAYEKMENLPRGDPRSLASQGDLLRCVNSNMRRVVASKTTYPLLENLAPIYLSWERAFLVFHESILGHLIGEEQGFFISSSSEISPSSLFQELVVLQEASSEALQHDRIGSYQAILVSRFALVSGSTLVEAQQDNSISPDINAFLHHSTVDRVWPFIPGQQNYQLDSNSLEVSFVFADKNAHWVKVKVRDILG